MSVPTGQSGPAVKMTVLPKEVVHLMIKLEAVRDSVTGFVQDNADALRGKPLAEDDVSKDAAEDFKANASAAIDAARKFAGELTKTINGLKDAAKTYHLVDETHATTMQQLTKDH
ncbi:PE domain-containing protein [Umezawaea endophytica]|uniref:PE domain-containing protein n=1 Tax=Umezawaea endophytica TaxID=1654476 RepID=A0A9X3AI82_9PSEU|nr:PE domain-containing protein [Umezawaea endophytica]MCS7482717.1 PE domain-containing protein [Umezawaea endophytica]